MSFKVKFQVHTLTVISIPKYCVDSHLQGNADRRHENQYEPFVDFQFSHLVCLLKLCAEPHALRRMRNYTCCMARIALPHSDKDSRLFGLLLPCWKKEYRCFSDRAPDFHPIHTPDIHDAVYSTRLPYPHSSHEAYELTLWGQSQYQTVR